MDHVSLCWPVETGPEGQKKKTVRGHKAGPWGLFCPKTSLKWCPPRKQSRWDQGPWAGVLCQGGQAWGDEDSRAADSTSASRSPAGRPEDTQARPSATSLASWGSATGYHGPSGGQLPHPNVETKAQDWTGPAWVIRLLPRSLPLFLRRAGDPA